MFFYSLYIRQAIVMSLHPIMNAYDENDGYIDSTFFWLIGLNPVVTKEKNGRNSSRSVVVENIFVIFTPNLGKMIQFYEYFSKGST